MKPYLQMPIQECGEALVAIPLDKFAVESPHPYVRLGADYQGKSPYYLREGVVTALIEAQSHLQDACQGWRLKIFDAYRPIAVQQFMVDYTFASAVTAQGLDITQLTKEQTETIWQQVYQLWAIPSDNPLTPPPHSTGAAIDLTLVNANGETVDMGGELDELSVRSQPDYYYQHRQLEAQQYHYYRQLLLQVMTKAGFRRHPGEWWHFSLGDQMWAWLSRQEHPHQTFIARYGKI